MKALGGNVRRYVQFTLYALALYVAGWGMTSYKSLFFSLGVGSLIGLFNLWSMHRDAKRIGEAAEQQKRTFASGMLSRFAAGALAAVLVIRYPEQFHVVGLVVGIMTPYVIILFHSLLQTKRA